MELAKIVVDDRWRIYSILYHPWSRFDTLLYLSKHVFLQSGLFSAVRFASLSLQDSGSCQHIRWKCLRRNRTVSSFLDNYEAIIYSPFG